MRAVLLLAVLAGAAVVLLVGQALVRPDLALIGDAGFAPTRISPNADGQDDVSLFEYSLSRNARVSLQFEAADGSVYFFRKDEPRAHGEYSVAFGGVVDGWVSPGEALTGEVLRRLLPDGDYTWRLIATDSDSGAMDERSGQLTIVDADSPLPVISTFSVWPDVFTPNQDGISDRTEINVYLEKGAQLQVWLLGKDGQRIYVAPRKEGRKPGEPGRHIFDYEGGVDLGADPPPDGDYEVVARSVDDEGQIVEQRAQLTIRNGGKPLAEIVPQSIGVDVVFAVQPWDYRYLTSVARPGFLLDVPENVQDNRLTALTLQIREEMLVFRLTVENYSEVPLRTTGPPPGTVYQQDQRAATLDAFDESGAWRVGIDCTTAETDYPWRWALGTDSDLYEEFDPDSGNTYSYLPPGEQVVVWGGIRFNHIEDRNPQNCWAGLIHEDVEVSIRNRNVGSREIELVE
ncbi:MAG: hypothetical protein OXB89_00275 [Anaerolineaceae bacterium]|nr:hypothetical protein [Anaerolineaceae bacterium]